MLKTLNLIGAGRVGQTLARLLARNGRFSVQDVLTRSLDSAQAAVDFVGAGKAVAALDNMREADVWMLAVPDGAIATVAARLAASGTARGSGPAMAFHCSGALSSAELAPLAAVGWPVASAHCILSFATPEAALAQFAGTPCGLEGDAAALSLLQPPLQAVGADCFAVSREHKLLYHAAAVFATNFLPVLQAVAQDLWRSSGVPEPMLPQLQARLLANAVHNLQTLGPAGALTGPAARGDVALVRRQAQAVAQWDAAAGQAYQALSQLAARLAGATPAFPDEH
jgi:predicted short-subunit dehydrogenase-like oxidoreductase (DUF2520 family)